MGTFGKVWRTFGLSLLGVLLLSGGRRSGMLLNVLQHSTAPTTKSYSAPKCQQWEGGETLIWTKMCPLVFGCHQRPIISTQEKVKKIDHENYPFLGPPQNKPPCNSEPLREKVCSLHKTTSSTQVLLSLRLLLFYLGGLADCLVRQVTITMA